MSIVEKIGNAVVEDACDFEKVAETVVVETYKKIEETVVDGFNKMSDGFVEKHLMKDGETLEEAKARLAAEQKEREAKKPEINIPDSNEIVKKNLEASLNAGKR